MLAIIDFFLQITLRRRGPEDLPDSRFLLLLSALALPAAAGNVYRCDAGDGITSYSNKRVSGATCKLVGSYKPQRSSQIYRRSVICPYKMRLKFRHELRPRFLILDVLQG